jgi:hypothetical protein
VKVRVECYAGYQGEQEPRSLYVEGERVEVVTIAARWREPDGDRFRVRANDGHTYVLWHRPEEDIWELCETRRTDA